MLNKDKFSIPPPQFEVLSSIANKEENFKTWARYDKKKYRLNMAKKGRFSQPLQPTNVKCNK